MLVELRKHGANVEMRIGLCFWPLQAALNGQSSLQKIESSAHFADASVVASHVVECHGLAELIVFAEFFGLLEQVEGAVDVLLFQIINSEDVADLAKLFAALRKLLRICAEMLLFYFE